MKNQNKYYAIWAEQGGFLECGYNSTSKAEIITAFKEHIGIDIVVTGNEKPTTKEWLHFMRYNTMERFRIKSSTIPFLEIRFERN